MYVLTNEQRVLFQCLRGEPVLSLQGADPQRLLHLFMHHRLLPLSGPVREHLPPAMQSAWKQELSTQTLHSLKLSAELTNLLELLRSLGFTPFPLKGPPLAHMLFGDPGQRHFGDIDILLPEEQFFPAMETLRRAGYTRVYPEQLSKRQWRTYAAYKKDAGLRHRERGIFLELHYGIHYHRMLEKRHAWWFFQGPGHILIRGMKVPVMQPEALFIYLVFHGAQHRFSRLFWLRDVDACLRNRPPDPEKVMEMIRKTRLHRLLGVTMALTEKYFHTPVPGLFRPCMQERRIEKLVRHVEKHILTSEQPPRKDKWMRHVYYLQLKPGLRYKWAVGVSILQRWRIKRFFGGY